MIGQLLLAMGVGLVIGTLLGLAIWRQLQRRAEQRRQRARHADVVENLDILCRALLQGQVDSSEASIRISVLLDCLPETVQPKVDLAAIHQLASDCDGFARGEGRKDLTPMERNRQDVARLDLEDQQDPEVRAAASRLAGVLPRWRERFRAD